MAQRSIDALLTVQPRPLGARTPRPYHRHVNRLLAGTLVALAAPLGAAPTDGVARISGCWRDDAGSGEMWMAPAGAAR